MMPEEIEVPNGSESREETDEEVEFVIPEPNESEEMQ